MEESDNYQDDEKEKEDLEEKLVELNRGIEDKSVEEKTEFDAIELGATTAQTIKSDDYMESLSKKNYAKYGLVLFCILLCGLFILRKNKERKNEFR